MTIHDELAEARDLLERLTLGQQMERRNHKDITQYEIDVAKREIAFHEKVLARSGGGPPDLK